MLRHARDFLGMIVLATGFAFLFQATAFATFFIPSESMLPTLQVGDRLTVSKYAYGWSRYSLPFDLELPASLKGRIFGRDPRRGDIVVFMHPQSGQRMIKRLIGLPGDRVAIRDGELILNGHPVQRRLLRSYRYREYHGRIVEVDEYEEALSPNDKYKILMRTHPIPGRDMEEVTVPPNRYFMLGDNRDNSADSRFPEMGMVPAENLIGRAEAILYSFYSCSEERGVTCADRRFATRLE
jgi:signal peptidase I